ncbi:ATP/GTP-binding protein [Streptomyces sp. NPDC085946]|uniref:ATP/GTP-binding protein n=1 Tax=Streptomyces sp. NPDC085946 TaxID=3365744 RepID=UPI0037CD10DB
MSGRRPPLGGRAAARWERAESAVTKALFLAVFLVGLVAQFVKPVGDALEGKVYLGGSLLCLVAYVLYAEVQRLNQRMEQRARPPAGALVKPGDLEAPLREALEARGEVHLAALGFTGETFVEHLKNILPSLPELGRNEQRSVHVRVLVPDFSRPIELPGQVGADGRAGDAPGFRRSLLRQIGDHEDRLADQAERLPANHRGTLSVEFRVLHMSPSLKLYFLNNDVVYEGLYDKLELRRDTLLDLLGYESRLVRWHWGDGEEARNVIVRRRTYFDTLWRAARPLAEARAAAGRPGAP